MRKIEGFYEEVVPALTDQQYKENFRLSRHTVGTIVELLGDEDGDGTGRTMEFKILLLLYYFGSITSFRKVALVFGLAVSTAWSFVDQVVHLLCGLKEIYIKFEGLQEVSNGFARSTGLRGIIGAVDGCHIPIPRPSENEHAYVNRKHTHSINLMGVCDGDRKFMDVCIGWPGSAHDSRVFRNSPLGQALEDQRFREVHLPAGSFLIGDCAFKLETWLITPFRENQLQANAGDGHTEAEKRVFNKKLSGARVVIEHTFGLLKGRFRRLTNLETKTVRKAIDITCAACVLHNMCMAGDDIPDIHEEAVDAGDHHDGAEGLPGAAAARRSALVDEVLAIMHH